MTELAIRSPQTSILVASSHSIKHPPSCLIDGENRTFWFTTGSFPQEAIVQFGEACIIKNVDIISTGIKSLELAKCEGQQQASSWEVVAHADFNDNDGEIQRISLKIPNRATATFLRIKVKFRILKNLFQYA